MRSIQTRLLPAIEVLLLFAVACVLFRAIAASPLRGWESSALNGQGYWAIEYAAVALLVIVFQVGSRRPLARYGVSFARPGQLLRTILIGLLPFLALGAALSLVDWRRWPGALLVSALSWAVLIVLGLALRGREVSALPLAACVGIGLPWLVFNPQGAAPVLVRTLYVYLLVGPAEELLFRGYALGRLDEAWGRPYTFFGVRWGFGVVAASVLFGLWHVVLMPAAEGVWCQALWTASAGLSLGYLRERTGSIVPSSFLHSVLNYMPLAELFVG